MKWVIWIALAMTASTAAAQRTVAVIITPDKSSLTKRFQYEIKEELAKSATLKETIEGLADVTVRYVLIDIDSKDSESGSVVAYGVTYTTFENMAPVYLTSGVGTCGAKVLARCAREQIAELASVDIWRKVPPSPAKPPTKK